MFAQFTWSSYFCFHLKSQQSIVGGNVQSRGIGGRFRGWAEPTLGQFYVAFNLFTIQYWQWTKPNCPSGNIGWFSSDPCNLSTWSFRLILPTCYTRYSTSRPPLKGVGLGVRALLYSVSWGPSLSHLAQLENQLQIMKIDKERLVYLWRRGGKLQLGVFTNNNCCCRKLGCFFLKLGCSGRYNWWHWEKWVIN